MKVSMRNGVCSERDSQGRRKHNMKKKIDGNGHEYTACDNCGALFIDTDCEDKLEEIEEEQGV